MIRPVGKSASNISTARPGDMVETARPSHSATDPHVTLGKLLTFEGFPFLSSKWGYNVHLSGLQGRVINAGYHHFFLVLEPAQTYRD